MGQGITGLFSGARPLFLHAMRFPATLRLVYLAPHPDDFDAVGVTMRFFRDNGNRIDVAVVTSGASGVEDEFSGVPTPEAKTELREKEQRASCRFFGLPEGRLTFLSLEKDRKGHPVDAHENRERLRKYLEARFPDLVFLPHFNDTSIGHQRTYAIFHQVALAGGHKPVVFLNRDPKTIHMRHDLYAVFGEAEAEWKRELLCFHQSQNHRNMKTRGYGFDERILRVNRQVAKESQLKGPYAEVFELEIQEARSVT